MHYVDEIDDALNLALTPMPQQPPQRIADGPRTEEVRPRFSLA